jgi:hypothetical protein
MITMNSAMQMPARNAGTFLTLPAHAALLGLLLLGASGAATAQMQAPWAGAVPVDVIEWRTADEAGNCQPIPGTNQISCRYFVSGNPGDINLLDDLALRPGLQFKRSGAHFYGFPRGTPGTVEMRRFMFCSVSLDCSKPAQTIYSHFIQPEKAYDSNGALVENPNFAVFRSPAYSVYLQDQGYNGFNLVLPTRARIGTKTFEFCPSGTQAIRKWYNGAFQRSQTTAGYKNDGNWRFSNSFAWRDSPLARGYETSYDDELFCGPIQAKALWVNNNAPTDRISQSDGTQRGSYISRFELSNSARTSFFTTQPTRSANFDQSRNLFWAPAESLRLTLQVGASSGTVNNLDANFISDRIASLVDERSGNVLQLDTFAGGNRAWILNRVTPNDSTPNIFIAPSFPVSAEAAVAARIENDVLFRVLAINNYTAMRVEAWDLRTATRLAAYNVAVPVVDSVNLAPNSYRPEISYSPARNTLYIVAVQTGRMFSVNMGNGNSNEIALARNGFGVRDVEIDSSRDVAYLAMRATTGLGLALNDTLNAGRIYELNLANNSISRQATTGIGPWQLAIAPVLGYMNVFVTNSAGVDSSVSQIETRNFTVTQKLPALPQPTSIIVQWLD